MNATLTIRLDAEQRERLRERASQLGKTDSELVREILQRELAEWPLHERVGHLSGSLSLKHAPREGWRKELKARNWRP